MWYCSTSKHKFLCGDAKSWSCWVFKVHENHLISTVKESQNAWCICVYEDIIVVSIEGKFDDQIIKLYDQEGNYYAEHSITEGSSQYGSVLATSRKSLLFTHHCGNFLFSVDINSLKNNLLCTKEVICNIKKYCLFVPFNEYLLFGLLKIPLEFSEL